MFELFMSLVGNMLALSSFNLAKKQAKSQTISALKNALRLTEKHIRDSRKVEFAKYELNDVESKELSQAWSLVAERIRPFNEGLANTFEAKSDYWIDPHGFRQEIQNGERRFDYRFRLSEVKKELKRIENEGI